MRTEIELLNTPDGQVWAQEFMDRFGKVPARAVDEGLLIGWFANAIECGVAAGYAKAIADRNEPMIAGVRRRVRRIGTWLRPMKGRRQPRRVLGR